MSEFNFSSFLKSMHSVGGTVDVADASPHTPTEEVPAIVSRSYAGRRLTFGDNRLDCDVESLFPSTEEESLPQLLVRTVTHLNADNCANCDLPYAKQVAVNNTFLCYALKSGDLRIISRVSNARVLVKTHEDDITSVHFLSPDANMLLMASMDRKISLMEVWAKDEEIEYRVMMCASLDMDGPIRLSWGPINDKIFVFAVQKWMGFVQWGKMTDGKEDVVEFDVTCEDGHRDGVRLLSFDSDVTFLRYRENGLVMGTSDGMLRIWNAADNALSMFFSESDAKLPDPLVQRKVADEIPVRHVEVFAEDNFSEASSTAAFTFLTVNYASQSETNTVIIKSWKCSWSPTTNEHTAGLSRELNLNLPPIDEHTSLSVDYCRRDHLLLLAERHWTWMLALRCLHEDELTFECMTKFPLVQEIVSMELTEKLSEEEGTENTIDVYCVQPMIVQQYILNPSLCLPEIEEEMHGDVASDTGLVVTEAVPHTPVTSDASFFKNFIEPTAAIQQMQRGLPSEAIAAPAAMPIPMPETTPELTMPRPPVLTTPDPAVHMTEETQIPLSRTVSTAKSSTSGTPMSTAPNGLSPKNSLHARTRSDVPVTINNPEPPTSVSQNVTAAAMHLLMVSQAERMPDTRPEKRDSDSDEPGLAVSDRVEKEMHRLTNLSMMDSSALPLNPDLSDLVETLERSVSNVKRMIQVLETKLGRAFQSVNKRLDANFPDVLTRLDTMQNPNRSGHEDLDIRVREHATAAMQSMLDIVQTTIQTEIKNTLRAVVGGAVQRVFAEFLSRQLSGLLNRCIENAVASSLSAAVNQGLQSNFRESFSDSIVPAFESAVQNMFGQIQTAFSAGLNEHLAGQNPMMTPQTHSVLQNGVNKLADFGERAMSEIDKLKSSISTLSSDVQTLRQDVHRWMATSNAQLSPSGGPSSTSRATPDVVISEIFTLLKDGDYESAFNKALSLSRIDVLNRIINVVDYPALFASEPCPLSQSVLLSLLNQIGCDLVTDTDNKLEWIKGAVTHLDTPPSCSRVGNLAMGVLDDLINRIQGMLKAGQIQSSCIVSAKMTLNMLIGARNMSASS